MKISMRDKSQEAFSYAGVVCWVPIIVTGGFFLFTILWAWFGPLDWGIKNATFYYLLICFAALVGGYVAGTLLKSQKTDVPTYSSRIGVLLLVCSGVSLLLYIPTCYYSTGRWYPDVYTGLTNTGLAYQKAKYYSVYAPKLFSYLRILCAPATFMVMPLTLFYHRELPPVSVTAGFSVIVLNVLLSIAQGVNNAVAMITMQMVLMLVILFFAEHDTDKKVRWRRRTQYFSIAVAIALLFVLYYGNTIRNRTEADSRLGIAGWTLDEVDEEGSLEQLEFILSKDWTPELEPEHPWESKDEERLPAAEPEIEQETMYFSARVKTDYPIISNLPDRVQNILYYLTGYFCHGYRGLDLAMEEPFTSCYGLGFSDFIRHNVLKLTSLFGTEESIYARSYLAKIERVGWSVGLVWPSFFTYPASDISFVGTVFFVALLGFLFGLSWKHALAKRNPFAMAAFMGFCTMVFYFSANNQMFQGGENCVGFLGCLLFWLISQLLQNKRGKM